MCCIYHQIQDDLVDVSGITHDRRQSLVELGGDLGHIFPFVAGHGDGGFNGPVEIGCGLVGRVGVGKFLHGTNDRGHAARSIETLVDGARHFGNYKIKIAVLIGVVETGGDSRRQDRCRILNRATILLEQFVNGFPGIAQEGEIVGDELRRRVDFMGDAGGELTYAFDLLRLAELGF